MTILINCSYLILEQTSLIKLFLFKIVRRQLPCLKTNVFTWRLKRHHFKKYIIILYEILDHIGKKRKKVGELKKRNMVECDGFPYTPATRTINWSQGMIE